MKRHQGGGGQLEDPAFNPPARTPPRRHSNAVQMPPDTMLRVGGLAVRPYVAAAGAPGWEWGAPINNNKEQQASAAALSVGVSPSLPTRLPDWLPAACRGCCCRRSAAARAGRRNAPRRGLVRCGLVGWEGKKREKRGRPGRGRGRGGDGG